MNSGHALPVVALSAVLLLDAVQLAVPDCRRDHRDTTATPGIANRSGTLYHDRAAATGGSLFRSGPEAVQT